MESPHEATTALGRILSADRPGGAILSGEAGDRRETIEAAIAALPPERTVFRLHGSAFAVATPYAALSILLSGLDQAPPSSLHGMIRTLSDYVRPAGQPPAVVIVSQAHQIDAGTLTVLSQLAQLGRITLVVHCDRLSDVPVDLAALLRAGVLEGITVGPLTPAAAEGLLEEVLDGPVSRFALTVLWRHAGGSASRLRRLARDCVAEGKLRRSGSCWILGSGPLPRTGAAGMPMTSLRHLPQRQRALLEALAVCGPRKVSELIHDGFAHELDALHAGGALELRNDHSGRIASLTPVQAAETLAAIEPDRRRELAVTLEALDPGFLSVLRAADELMLLGDVRGAVSLFAETDWPAPGTVPAGVPGPPAGLYVAWAEARARVAAGDLDGAEAVVRRFPQGSSAALSVVAASVAVARGDVREAHARLDLVPAEHLPGLLSPASSGLTGEAVRCRAQALRAEALALADDQDGALRLLDRLDAELGRFEADGIIDDVLGASDRAVLAQSVLNVLLACGRIERCREVAEAVLDGRHGHPLAAQYAELVLAVLDAVTGEREQAHHRAARLAAQLEAGGNPHELQVARAITVFCSDGEDVRDSTLLEALMDGQSGQPADQPLGRLGWLAELMLAWSTARTHSPEAGTARVLALADRAAEAGLYAVEFTALASVFQLGEFRVAARLAEAAACTQTTTSAPHLLLARWVLEDDEELRVQALEGLAAAGFAAHLEWAATPLLRALPPQALRRIAEAAPSRRPAGGAEDQADADPAWMAELTRREREVARLVVEGRTNAVIARITGISIRTVEGHLYQIYAKLQVRGRADLARLARAQVHLGAGR
ncbi:LuxR family transcriptional regulator [Citricoccus sp. SGAir0253]|uniref:helix-turn-helix transcriptional regulator n=1 Tax=Citricoccus sp. SGAir0253 TaxID=2567881 RepID=UPI0010CD2691|nr:LuxR C-terminal-related transcriptional regulator [Citricoccus sp. SGAir0253]QCU78626.1 LuxR family transcriptional regulator [Citricoccus sp. SGAir0253]